MVGTLCPWWYARLEMLLGYAGLTLNETPLRGRYGLALLSPHWQSHYHTVQTTGFFKKYVILITHVSTPVQWGCSLSTLSNKYLIATFGPRICLFCAEKIFRYLDIFHLESIDFCGIQLMKELSDKTSLSCPCHGLPSLPSLRPGEEIQWQGYKKLNVWPLTIELNRILLKYNSSRMWGIIELY